MQSKTIGLGIDSVEIERFKDWHTYPPRSLRRIFSEQEIEYCLASPARSAERFAARFAAREALLKSLCQAYPEKTFALLSVCKATTIIKTANGAPRMEVNWHILGFAQEPELTALASWTHTKSIATAIVMISGSALLAAK